MLGKEDVKSIRFDLSKFMVKEARKKVNRPTYGFIMKTSWISILTAAVLLVRAETHSSPAPFAMVRARFGSGLLYCTLGGVWLGIMVPFTVWALHLAGTMSFRWFATIGVSFAPVLIVCSGGLAVARQLN